MDAWKVGISLTLANGVSQGLGIIAREVAGLDSKVAGLITKFKELSTTTKLALGGGLAIAGAVGLGEAYKTVAEKGMDLLSVQNQLVRAGVAQNDVLKMTTSYFDSVAKAVPTSTVDGFLKNVMELRSVTGSTESAQAGAPFAMKLEALIKNATGSNVEGTGFNLYRAAEMRGTMMTDPDGTSKFMTGMAQAISGSGGKLTPETFLQMAKRAGGSWLKLDPGFINGPMAVAAADMGGDTAGTATMSLEQFLMGSHTLTKQQYGVLSKAGLIDPRMVHTDKGGRINIDPGGIKGTLEGISDPYGWTKDVVAPAIAKMSKGDEMVFTSLLGKIGGNRNVFRMLQMFSDPGIQQQIAKDMQIWGGAMPVDQAYGSMMQSDPKGVTSAYEAQKKSMFEAIGGPFVQAAIPVMKEITSAFTSIGAFADGHKDAAKNIANITMAVTGLLGAFGALGIGAAGVNAVKNMINGGGLMGSAVALDASAAALTEAAVALGARGSFGAGIDALAGAGGTAGAANVATKGGLFAWIGRVLGNNPFLGAAAGSAYMMGQSPDKGELSHQGMYQFRQFAGQAGYGPMNGPHGPSPATIQVNPQMRAEIHATINGREVAAAITSIIMDSIKSLIPHPTGAPMSGNYAPSIDGVPQGQM